MQISLCQDINSAIRI